MQGYKKGWVELEGAYGCRRCTPLHETLYPLILSLYIVSCVTTQWSLYKENPGFSHDKHSLYNKLIYSCKLENK